MADVEKGTVHATSPDHAFRNGTDPAAALRNSPTSAVKSNIANPGPLGLISFASTTLILSLYNAQVRGINTPNVVVGMACFCGGLAQFLAGMWEFPKGNTFGATAFTSYGAFWMSYAAILIPGFGVGDAYSGAKASQTPSAVGVYLMTWMSVTFIFFIVSLRKSVSFIALFGFLTLTFMCLGIADLGGLPKAAIAGGGLGVITAIIAYYIALSEMLTAEKKAIVHLPLFAFKHD
ncbi:Gpr1 family protein [Marasmius fiardii PR-910]|nr:Gpr1 family protein [Marasmius fiardii PR-910]